MEKIRREMKLNINYLSAEKPVSFNKRKIGFHVNKYEAKKMWRYRSISYCFNRKLLSETLSPLSSRVKQKFMAEKFVIASKKCQVNNKTFNQKHKLICCSSRMLKNNNRQSLKLSNFNHKIFVIIYHSCNISLKKEIK